MGGTIPFFGLMALFLVIALMVFGCLSYRSGLINKDLKDLPENLYMQWEGDDFRSIRG